MRILRYGMLCVFMTLLMLALPAQAYTRNGSSSFPAITQFGTLGDSTFVFCHDEASPARSIKHLAISPPSIEIPGS